MAEQNFGEFTATVMAAASNSALYSERHPIVAELSERAFTLLNDLYENDQLGITVISDNLVFNSSRTMERGLQFDSLAKQLMKKGVEKLEIHRGITREEFTRFIAALASRELSPAGPHISVGAIEVRTGVEDVNVRTLIEECLAKVREVFQEVPGGRRLDVRGLEETVRSLLSALRREANVLSLLSPVRSYDEYTYVHATNVSILTLFLARAFGAGNAALADIGLAGLLHDIGKISVPREVLDKKSDLDVAEWEQMKLHPIHGARYLSTMPEIPRLSMIAAFEHHMKFDGSGYPQVGDGSRRQHVVSQMVSIADFFDALRTERPYREAVETVTIISLLKRGAGKEFNPLLVDTFTSALTASIAG